MEQSSIMQEYLKWVALASILVMAAFIVFGLIKGLYFEKSLKARRR